MTWFKRTPKPPEASAGNSGVGHIATIGFSNSDRSWEENANLVDILSQVLAERGHQCKSHDHWVQVGSFQFQPQLVSLIPLTDGGVRTVSTIDVTHTELLQSGLFEYQHATGDGTEQSFRSGFENWAETDLPVWIDFDKREPESCTMLTFDLPATEDSAPVSRQVLLGPTIQYCQPTDGESEEHGFCPCCFVTRNYDAIDPLITGGGLHGVRFFALRDANREAQADCRVDGLDYDDGTVSLRNYAGTWPDRGYEYRKQYVLIRDKPV